jgi:hypothetical protein
MRELDANMRRDLEYRRIFLRFRKSKNNKQGNDEHEYHVMLNANRD